LFVRRCYGGVADVVWDRSPSEGLLFLLFDRQGFLEDMLEGGYWGVELVGLSVMLLVTGSSSVSLLFGVVVVSLNIDASWSSEVLHLSTVELVLGYLV